MSSQGDFDPASFDVVTPSTWPRPIGGGPYYAGQYWVLTGPVTVNGVPAVAGDFLYVVSWGRPYGAGNYGDAVYGWNDHGPWADLETSWMVFARTAPPWDRPASPYSGCPFGDRAPGWNVVVEVLRMPPDMAARTYGTGNYGDAVYGDTGTSADLVWVDITTHNYGIVIRRGNPDGTPVVQVAHLQLDLVDTSADLFPMSQPETWYGARTGSRIRVGLLSPAMAYTPLFVGRVEQVVDEHDAPPRLLQVDAFGSAFDLVVDRLRWQRGAESAVVRTQALMEATAYDWSPILSWPPDDALLADPTPRDIVVRDELDRVAKSTRTMFDVAPNGAPRFRHWPDPGDGNVLDVADCAPGLVAAAVLTGDMAELVNSAQVSNVAPAVATTEDVGSQAYFGRRTEGLGMPFTDLSCATSVLQTITDEVVYVYGRTVNRVESIVADIVTDPGWFAELVGLDVGRSLRFTRRAFPDHPLMLDAVVCGFEHRMTPNQWQASIFTTTRTPSV